MSPKDPRDRAGRDRSRSPQERRRGGDASASSYHSRSASGTSRRERRSRSKSGEAFAGEKGYRSRSPSQGGHSEKRMNPEVENEGARDGGAENGDRAENGVAGGDNEQHSKPAATEQENVNADYD